MCTRVFSVISVSLLAAVFVMSGCAGRQTEPVATQATTQPPQATPPEVVEQPDASGPLLADDANAMTGREVSDSATPLQKVHFEYDKSTITGEAQTILTQNARYLKTNPSTFIRIEGHADERGSVEYNQALGERRANAAKEYLVSLGIEPSRMDTISYGEDRPISFEHNEYAWAQNRRAEFRILSE